MISYTKSRAYFFWEGNFPVKDQIVINNLSDFRKFEKSTIFENLEKSTNHRSSNFDRSEDQVRNAPDSNQEDFSDCRLGLGVLSLHDGHLRNLPGLNLKHNWVESIKTSRLGIFLVSICGVPVRLYFRF